MNGAGLEPKPRYKAGLEPIPGQGLGPVRANRGLSYELTAPPPGRPIKEGGGYLEPMSFATSAVPPRSCPRIPARTRRKPNFQCEPHPLYTRTALDFPTGPKKGRKSTIRDPRGKWDYVFCVRPGPGRRPPVPAICLGRAARSRVPNLPLYEHKWPVLPSFPRPGRAPNYRYFPGGPAPDPGPAGPARPARPARPGPGRPGPGPAGPAGFRAPGTWFRPRPRAPGTARVRPRTWGHFGA
jgi:hypothetical protein